MSNGRYNMGQLLCKIVYWLSLNEESVCVCEIFKYVLDLFNILPLTET